MSSQYVGDYVQAQNEIWAQEEAAEREWHEREGEHIPAWMDEEEITARAYEYDLEPEELEKAARESGLLEDRVDDYTRTRYAESPDAVDDRIRAFQENYGETAEERVRAYQEEEAQESIRIKAW